MSRVSMVGILAALAFSICLRARAAGAGHLSGHAGEPGRRHGAEDPGMGRATGVEGPRDIGQVTELDQVVEFPERGLITGSPS